MSKSAKEKNETGKVSKPAKQDSVKTGKKGKTAKELMTRHISDEDAVITDEDFKNLNIDVDITSDVAHHPLNISDDKERPKDEDKDPKVKTPWDVIS
ncbi:hypothetical protein CAP36_14245 [Chitinophagaceae bacterium IBVUCB2]|nr:hypothetical protein CAP36_14245 [Chitinophagaceae bacterium IBVUCB2]